MTLVVAGEGRANFSHRPMSPPSWSTATFARVHPACGGLGTSADTTALPAIAAAKLGSPDPAPAPSSPDSTFVVAVWQCGTVPSSTARRTAGIPHPVDLGWAWFPQGRHVPGRCRLA